MLKKTKNTKPVAKKSKLKTPKVCGPFNSDNDWRIKEDAETLKRAMAIKNDPSRLKSAQDFAAKESEALSQVLKMK